MRLTAWAAPTAVTPGGSLPVALQWQAVTPAGQDYTVFLHLRDRAGRTVANGDATPTWFLPRHTSQWPAGGLTMWDAHAVAVPADVQEGQYDLVAGWYYWETGERLQASDGTGNPRVTRSSWGRWWWMPPPARVPISAARW